MCDTMVALGNSTADGSVIFAKNSDRQPNEPHIIIHVPRRKHNLKKEKDLKATYISIPQIAETSEVVLLKPSWMWGCEMGWNEHGLNIGNEAVFTREKNGPDALTGMDMVRIALERCKTAFEAVNTITALLDLYGQGGNCGYEKQFFYHNSFLIADAQTAWVLETAGKYWAAKQVRDIYCISNCLSIGNDFEKCHPDLVKHAVEMKRCKDEKDFNFAGCYSNRLFTHFSGSLLRRSSSGSVLEKEKGNITVDTMKKALRSHEGCMDGRVFTKGSVRSVCMHAGGLIGDQTTGSYIASIKKKNSSYLVTGASAPCISVFKPVLVNDRPPVFSEGDEEKAVDYWMKREKLHRFLMASGDTDGYMLRRDRLEKDIDSIITGKAGKTRGRNPAGVQSAALDMEQRFVEDEIRNLESSGVETAYRGGIYYRYYWKKQDKKLAAGRIAARE